MQCRALNKSCLNNATNGESFHELKYKLQMIDFYDNGPQILQLQIRLEVNINKSSNYDRDYLLIN